MGFGDAHGTARLALPRAVRGAGLADPLVGPLAVAAEAGVDSDELVALGLELGDGPGDDLLGGLGDGRVLEDEVGLGEVVNDALEDRLGSRDRGTRRVLGVRVPEKDLLVATVREDLEREVVDRAVGRAEVQRLDTEDTDKRSLNLLELGVDLVVVELGEVLVRPGVGPERVALRVELADLCASAHLTQLLTVDAVVDAVVVVAVVSTRYSETHPLRKKVALPPFRSLAMSSSYAHGPSVVSMEHGGRQATGHRGKAGEGRRSRKACSVVLSPTTLTIKGKRDLAAVLAGALYTSVQRTTHLLTNNSKAGAGGRRDEGSEGEEGGSELHGGVGGGEQWRGSGVRERLERSRGR